MEVRVHFISTPAAPSSSPSSAVGSTEWLVLMRERSVIGDPHGHGAIPVRVTAHLRAMHEKLPVMLQGGHVHGRDGGDR